MNTKIKQWLFDYSNVVLLVFISLSLVLKFSVISVGAPYTTIDDYTLFNGGFLVWFGNAPPQRTYIESWLVGASCISTYLYQLVNAGNLASLNVNVVSDAYRAFTLNPDPFVLNYRYLMLLVDMATAGLVYWLALTIMSEHKHKKWLAVMSCGLFLLCYNTIWCFVVARPDTATAFFSALGLLAYFKSNYALNKYWFFSCAIALGIAAGFKLHAAIFVFFILFDMLRHRGFKNHFILLCVFATISFLCFLITAGSTLFDPTLYIKLRLLNIKDDASPWIHWGDQFITLLRGAGWVIVPVIICGVFINKFKPYLMLSQKIKSLIFLSLLGIAFFCAIRALRAYWMLPFLPLFYCLAIYIIISLPNKLLRISILSSCVGVFLYQSVTEISALRNSHQGELRDWVKENIKVEEPIYVVGFNTLFLSCNTECLKTRKAVLEDSLASALQQNELFTVRHIRLWEERSTLMLIDMLNEKSRQGYEYYQTNETPLEILKKFMPLSKIKYIFIMHGIDEPEGLNDLKALNVESDFEYVLSRNAPGGSSATGGLLYDIYRRKAHDAT